jgi:hypothetical protein
MLRKRIWMVGCVLPWLVGCSSVRLTYGQGPTLAYWWLDGHVDFSSEQTPRAKAALDDWFSWHRATQLSDYAGLLATAQRLAVDNVTSAQVCRYTHAVELRLMRAFEPAVAPMAEIVRSLSPAQLRHLELRYAKGNDEWQREHLQADAAERQSVALKRWVERAEIFYGSLDDGQRGLVAAGMVEPLHDPQRWFDERRQRQQDILSTLRQLLADKADQASTEAALRAIALHMVQSPRADYRALRERADTAQCALIAQLHNTTTPAQRQHAVKQFKSWEDDLRALAGPAGAQGTAIKGSAVP